MKLEELAETLADIRQQLFRSMLEKSAPVANEALLTELRKRITQGSGRKKASQKPATKLNEQQSKFLKAPVNETFSADDRLQVEQHGDAFRIVIDSSLPTSVKDNAKIRNGDLEQYQKTLSDETKKQLGQLQ